MKTDKIAEFNFQALLEAIERMKPDLIVAHEAAGKIVTHNDEQEERAHRLEELGCLMHMASKFGTANITLLTHVAIAMRDGKIGFYGDIDYGDIDYYGGYYD